MIRVGWGLFLFMAATTWFYVLRLLWIEWRDAAHDLAQHFEAQRGPEPEGYWQTLGGDQ